MPLAPDQLRRLLANLQAAGLSEASPEFFAAMAGDSSTSPPQPPTVFPPKPKKPQPKIKREQPSEGWGGTPGAPTPGVTMEGTLTSGPLNAEEKATLAALGTLASLTMGSPAGIPTMTTRLASELADLLGAERVTEWGVSPFSPSAMREITDVYGFGSQQEKSALAANARAKDVASLNIEGVPGLAAQAKAMAESGGGGPTPGGDDSEGHGEASDPSGMGGTDTGGSTFGLGGTFRTNTKKKITVGEKGEPETGIIIPDSMKRAGNSPKESKVLGTLVTEALSLADSPLLAELLLRARDLINAKKVA